jgi:sigma-E factor negative regulatory protein RseA
MKQNMSALMDGELFDDEADALLDKLRRNPDSCREWDIYHLIGDTLRHPEHIKASVGKVMHDRLQAEPTVLAPHARTGQRARWFALSAAASVMALALVTWLSVKIGVEPAPQVAMQQTSIELRPASFSSSRMNEYLMAHQEFSPSADVQGAATYISSMAGQ